MIDPSPRPELLALLAAAKTEPDDDTPKLVLADWLEEQDDPADRARGEYLRNLVRSNRFASRDITPDDVNTHRDLWDRHKEAWFGRLGAVGFRGGGDLHSSEWGLPFLSIDGAKAVTKAARAVASTEEYAWVAGLRFHRLSTGQFVRFVNGPLYGSVAGLHIQDCNANPVAALADSPGSLALRELDLGMIPLNGTPLAGSPYLAGLRRLRLRRVGLADIEFKALCDSPHLNRLHALDVTNNQLTIHAARAFADATGLPALTELNLGGTNRIGPDGTLILVNSPNAARLRRLNMWSNGVADYGVEALCRQAHVCNLTHLDLSGNVLTNRAAVALAEAEHLKTLEELDLRTNGIGGEGALALAKSPHLGNLRRLDLRGNRIPDPAAAALRERFGDRVSVG